MGQDSTCFSSCHARGVTPASRPLRALGVVLGGWTAARVVALWPVSGAAIEAQSLDAARVAPAPTSVTVALDNDVPLFAKRPLSARGMKALVDARGAASVMPTLATAAADPVEATGGIKTTVTDGETRAERGIVSVPGLSASSSKNRFSGSAWALMRSEGGSALANGGQLGGSQIGMRLFYAPRSEPLAITARVSTAINAPNGREAAVGIALRGRHVGLIAEHRFSLDKGGRDAPAVFAYGGVSDVKVGGLKLDGYVQTGVVGIKEPAAFVDGAVRVEREILKAESASLAVGAGAWGGAQKGAARIDVGPQIVARVAVAQTNLRVSAEWRQRVAGDAAPASGPSVTVGFDF
jgi:hypothetical protein